ncbi:hypothetical protein K469DRAFT_737382 [Zopfia rhizophila CBS 207.26]|uniref:Rhodanese domain-containing protein n=1 Tax=Zopfia rhizophila CBS 207.26 TaxID=1314779 RepID=A0A6A6EDB0_9PEZI|nr:hypothetical protein K469DRAFT_737382 [Zopfia rhizophila CBS 207.26]
MLIYVVAQRRAARIVKRLEPTSLVHSIPGSQQPDPPTITLKEVFDMLNEKKSNDRRDFVLVDLRRNDYKGGTIYNSINLPAQSLYHSIPTLYTMFKAAASSRGRGTRAAGWFDDYFKTKGDMSMTSLVLAEGIEGWVDAGPEYIGLMNEYDGKVWGKD